MPEVASFIQAYDPGGDQAKIARGTSLLPAVATAAASQADTLGRRRGTKKIGSTEILLMLLALPTRPPQ
ncbi:MAG: hypothetical protein C4576_34370 [Desulfobacteraceae bacterium]|nr:MAG: hypothetical protein C4576_34370 [Desulfobacteraceae bacterium]